LSAYVDAHKALISPVRRLPLDIIQEIFTACIPTHRNCVMSALEAPVLLGRICSSWRYICLSTPHLWARLHIVEPQRPYNASYLFDTKQDQRLETTKMWLGQSGNYPLSISLQSTHDRHLVSHNELIRTLLPFASRWQHISFTALPSSLRIVSHLTEADVPMLKSVSIKEPFGYGDYDIRWDSFGFLRAPQICSLDFEGGSFSPLELPLPWSGLVHLSFTKPRPTPTDGFLTSETALEILSRCPQLRSCGLYIQDPDDIVSSGLEDPILELSFLHTFDLAYGTVQAASRLFGWVSFPHLRNLKLRGRSDDENMPYVRFLATAPLIEKLDITDEQLSKLFLASFLRELPPTLRELNISKDFSSYYENPSFDDEILDSFIPSVDFPSPCCPGLQALEIRYSCAISDKALLRFLKSRTLKRVVICFDRVMELDIRPELQSLVQNGLHLELAYHPPMQSFSPWEGLPDAWNFFLAP
ncbi:hypothetical protein FB451DRAFT_1057190, partial [Mycena latifolia]